MKTDKTTSSANTLEKRLSGRKPQTARRSRWFISRSALVNFGALVLLFTAIILINQFGQRTNSDKEKPAEVSAQAQVEPTQAQTQPAADKETPKKPAIKKFASTNRLLRNSLLQKKKSVAWGDFIPFEKK